MCSPHGTLGYKPNRTYPFSDKCPTYPFSDKCHHKSNQLSHRGVRSGECLRKLQTSTLPLSEGGILCHAKSVTEVLKLHPGLVRTSSNLLICRKVLHQYFLPLHHVSDEMVLDLNVVQFVMKHWIIRELHTTLVTIMNNGGIQHMFE
jgi:hypothetical protein